MIARGALLALLAVAAAPSFAAPAALEVDLAPRTATVGDPVIVTLGLRLEAAERDRPAIFPDWGESWGEATVLATSPVVRRDGGDHVLLVQKLRLAAYRPGRIALPPREIHLGGTSPATLSTPADLALEIRSVLPGDGKEAAPEPPDPPRALPVADAFAWTAAALAVLALAGAVLLGRRPAAPAAARRASAPSPLAELERALGALDALEPTEAERALSLALRRYLGRSLGIPAAESTTSELARRLDQRGLERDLVRRLVRLLRDADGVKFALRPADAEIVARGREEARTLAQACELHLHPPTAGEAA